MSAQISKVKLQLEALEDRYLMTAGPSSQIVAPIQITHIQNQQTIAVFAGPINMTLSLDRIVSLTRTYEKFCGLRPNHNQTLVRDRSRTGRVRSRKNRLNRSPQ